MSTGDQPPSDRAGVEGGCLCGRVRFRYDGALGGVRGGALGATTVCHCAQCRKAQGYASAVVPALAAPFAIERGADAIVEYESSPGKVRAFCGACGSPLYSRRDDAPDRLRLRLGALDSTPDDLRVDAHIHTREAPSWSWPSKAPAYPEAEPGRD